MADKKSREVDFIVDTNGITEDVRKKAGALTVKIDVDVAEALTGLKAVTREARKAAAALREVEAQAKRNALLPGGDCVKSFAVKTEGPTPYTATIHAGERIIATLPGELSCEELRKGVRD